MSTYMPWFRHSVCITSDINAVKAIHVYTAQSWLNQFVNIESIQFLYLGNE